MRDRPGLEDALGSEEGDPDAVEVEPLREQTAGQDIAMEAHLIGQPLEGTLPDALILEIVVHDLEGA